MNLNAILHNACDSDILQHEWLHNNWYVLDRTNGGRTECLNLHATAKQKLFLF